MPGFTCCVPGCYNNSHRDRELRFYTFPKDQTQREVWLKNISRAGVSGCFSTFQPTTGHRVCSVHFPGGRKTYTIRVPTLFPLRGVNERKSRRGRNKKLFAALPGSVPGVVTGAVPGSVPIITSVVSIAGEGEGNGETTVVQIGQNGQYITPVDLTAAGNAADHSEDFVGAGGRDGAGAGSCAGSCAGSTAAFTQAAAAAAGVLIAEQCGVGLSGEDHCYSLTNGTTSAELLRKLNEQRDIIALMEVKMKEMKNTIRQLRITEAQLQEELRERDRLLSAASTTAATACSSSTSPSSSSSVRKKV